MLYQDNQHNSGKEGHLYLHETQASMWLANDNQSIVWHKKA